jgi:hypothetical protein
MDWYTRKDQQIVPQGTGHNRGGFMNEGEGPRAGDQLGVHPGL